jgi:hypothetical protein
MPISRFFHQKRIKNRGEFISLKIIKDYMQFVFNIEELTLTLQSLIIRNKLLVLFY